MPLIRSSELAYLTQWAQQTRALKYCPDRHSVPEGSTAGLRGSGVIAEREAAIKPPVTAAACSHKLRIIGDGEFVLFNLLGKKTNSVWTYN